MMIAKILSNKILLTFFIIGVFIASPLATASGFATQSTDNNTDYPFIPQSLSEQMINQLQTDTSIPSNQNLDALFDDNNNTYQEAWDPWLTRAAIHAVATHEDWLALASGYLYDDQIHLYRYNEELSQYTLVWEVGGGVFQSDVMALAFADTNYNNLVEIIAGGEDGRLYVFEQKHIYDPYTNTENMFELVYQSDRMGRIFDLKVQDTDGDYKQDIIVGTADVVRFFEYSDHSGYPFSEEHWIDYEEVYSISVTDALDNYTGIDNLYAVTSLEVADTNSNGLWEIVVGTRAGTIFLLENNGTVIQTENNNNFPFMQDDSYKFIWNSANSIQRSITDMESGDLDSDGYREILIAVQGVGAYILDQIEGEFGTYRIQRDYAGWESDPSGAYPLDKNIDWMLNSSSLESVDGSIADFNPDNFTYYNDYNVYTQYNASYINPEPFSNDVSSNMSEIFPYRTALAQPSDDIFTTFDASGRDAWAILDWGYHEEAAGNGIGTLYDFIMDVGPGVSPLNHNFQLSISQDNITWYQIDSSDIRFRNYVLDDKYEVEVDNVLNELGWTQYRYLKINVTSGILKVDSLETRYFNKPIYDAQSAAIGELTLKDEVSPRKIGFIGTVNGAILGVAWNATSQVYEVVWDSWVDERYKLSKNIFDLEQVTQTSNFPAWLDLGTDTFDIDLTSGLHATMGGGDILSYDIDNFYNYREENALEFIFTSSNDQIGVYSQPSPMIAPQYDDILTNALFNTDFWNLQSVFSIPGSPQAWMDQDPNGYYAASIVPMDYTPDIFSESNAIAKLKSGYLLFVSKWDGLTGVSTGPAAAERTEDSVQVSVWYLQNLPNTGAYEGLCPGIDRCSFFTPMLGNISQNGVTPVDLTNSEISGQMTGILGQSEWMPKLNSYDVIGTDSPDLILTNGKVHLLETTNFVEPLTNATQAVNIFGDLDTLANPGYFREINEDEKGRIWTNAEPIDLDRDGDMDIILAFARYDQAHFGLEKASYGFTYFENQGTNEDPKWVEKKKAVTNNDEDSNFRVERWTEPIFTFESYNFGEEGFDNLLGYHPMYREDRPSRVFMFQPQDWETNQFLGTIRQFTASYDHPTSLIAATYPEAVRLDVNLQYRVTGDRNVNYGFHIIDTWDNDDELNRWTLSVDAGHDLDQDGDNEVIVGDFNNNAYVFEHLSNNTFKRAYKTFDLNRTIITDESPYAHEEFDGISGTFKRTIFDHAEFVLAGIDLNQNGLQEFIVATPDMIFIFESILTPGGFVQQDSFELVRTIDLFNHQSTAGMAQEDIKITAISTGGDVNQDGDLELLVGVDAGLLIFDVLQEDDIIDGYFAVKERYFANAGQYQGLWNLPGNYHLYPDLRIDAIVSTDIDQNGRLDIIIAGRDRTEAQQIQSGFIYFLSWDGLEYYKSIPETFFTDTILYNPITALMVEDQDYDGIFELIIGHESGVDIYEFPAAEKAALREVITSDPHYQLPTRTYLSAPETGAPLGACEYAKQIGECQTGITLPQSMSGEKDVYRLSSDYSNALVMVVAVEYPALNRQTLNLSYSVDNGQTWVLDTQFTVGLPTVSNSFFSNFEDISITETDTGIIWVSWVARMIDNDSGDHTLKIGIARNNYQTQPWVNAYFSQNYFDNTNARVVRLSPSIYPLYDLSDNIGMVHIDPHENVFNDSSQLRFSRINPDGVRSLYSTIPEWADDLYNSTDYIIESVDMVQLDSHLSKLESQRYGLVFSGYLNSERLAFDLDLWYSEVTMNTSSLYNFTRPDRMHLSGIDEVNPNLIELKDTGRLMVTFEADGLRQYGGLHAMWSDNNGTTWEGPYDMSHPLGLDPMGINLNIDIRAYSSASKNTFRVGLQNFGIFMNYFESYQPVLAEGAESGFAMVYNVDVGFETPLDRVLALICSLQGLAVLDQIKEYEFCNYSPIDYTRLVVAYNPYSNFSLNHLGGVTALDTGDTDRDGRQEIAVASGDQAYLYEIKSTGETFIQHTEKWISKEYGDDLTDISIGDINGNGFEEIVLSAERGIVNAYEMVSSNFTQSFNESQIQLNIAAIEQGNPADPFIFLGSEFTQRTDFVLYDYNGDGFDDVYVIDDNFIGGSDTEQLRFNENYNDVIWAHDLPNSGKYLEEYAIGDLDGNGNDDIVAVFEYGLYGFDLITGDVIFNYSTYADLDDDGIHRNPHVWIGDFFSDDGNEVLFVHDFKYFGFDYVLAYTISRDSTLIDGQSYIGFNNQAVVLADLEGDAAPELVMTFRNATNMFHQQLRIVETETFTDFNPGAPINLNYFAPMMDIAVGEFDTTQSGDEIMLVLEYSEWGNLFGFDFSKFPTIFWILAWDSGANALTGTSTGLYLGFSGFEGPTKDFWVVDFSNDGQADLVVEAQNGGLQSYDTSKEVNPGWPLFLSTGTFTTNAVPYAEHSTLVGDFCGPNSFVTTTAGNVISCFDSVDFSTEKTPSWTTEPLDFDTIRDIQSGNLDGDAFSDDILIIGIGGFVWVYGNTFYGSQADGDNRLTVDFNDENLITAITYVSFFSILGLMTTFGYYKKSSIIEIINKLR